MKNKKRKNKKNFILILIFICILILLLMLKILKSESKNEEFKYDVKAVEESVNEYINDKVVPRNISDFVLEYKGRVSRDDIYVQLNKISKYLPKVSSNLKTTSARKYYQNNRNEVKSILGISKEAEFVKFAEYLSNYDLENSKLEYCQYEKKSLVKNVGYWDSVFKFKYENNDEIQFTIEITNNANEGESNLKLNIQ